MFLKSDMSMILDMLIFVILMHYYLVYTSAQLFSFQHVTILMISKNIRNVFVTLTKLYFHQGIQYTKFYNFCLYILKRVTQKRIKILKNAWSLLQESENMNQIGAVVFLQWSVTYATLFWDTLYYQSKSLTWY